MLSITKHRVSDLWCSQNHTEKQQQQQISVQSASTDTSIPYVKPTPWQENTIIHTHITHNIR